MKEKIKLPVVDDEERFLGTISKLLERGDFDVVTVTCGASALAVANEKDFDCALIDLRMPEMSGEQVLAELKKAHPDLQVIILTGHGSLEAAICCSRMGAFSYLQKPCELDTLLHVCYEAYEFRKRKKEGDAGHKTIRQDA